MMCKEGIKEGRWYLEDYVTDRNWVLEEGSWIHCGLGFGCCETESRMNVKLNGKATERLESTKKAPQKPKERRGCKMKKFSEKQFSYQAAKSLRFQELPSLHVGYGGDSDWPSHCRERVRYRSNWYNYDNGPSHASRFNFTSAACLWGKANSFSL